MTFAIFPFDGKYQNIYVVFDIFVLALFQGYYHLKYLTVKK